MSRLPRSKASMNSGNVSQVHGRPSVIATPGMSSTPAISIDQHVVVVGRHGREPDPAVAHHHGRHPVRRRRRQPVRPDGLAVVVGVQVDEARGDEQAGRVDLPCGVAVTGPPLRSCRRARRRRRRTAHLQPVDDGPVTDQEVVGHLTNLRPAWAAHARITVCRAQRKAPPPGIASRRLHPVDRARRRAHRWPHRRPGAMTRPAPMPTALPGYLARRTRVQDVQSGRPRRSRAACNPGRLGGGFGSTYQDDTGYGHSPEDVAKSKPPQCWPATPRSAQADAGVHAPASTATNWPGSWTPAGTRRSPSALADQRHRRLRATPWSSRLRVGDRRAAGVTSRCCCTDTRQPRVRPMSHRG